jgi:Tol biopolymer transport system component
VVDVGKSPALERRLFTVGHSCSELGTSAAAQRIAVTCHDPAAGPSIWVVDARTGDASDTKVPGEAPELSPDGTRVAFERSGDLHVLTLKSGETLQLTKTPFPERSPRFSPDGARLYFESTDVDPNLSSRRVGAIAYVEVP